MKAVIGGRLLDIPDHSTQPGRVLVHTLCSARRLRKKDVMDRVRLAIKLAGARRYNAVEMLRYDGFRMLWQKAGHMFRREIASQEAVCASFVGIVANVDSASNGLSVGDFVAGISPTHPPDTGKVIARPEHLFRITADTDANLAACVLYGGMAVHAIEYAEQLTDGGIGLAGTGVLALIASAVLNSRGREVIHLADASNQRAPKVWIDADGENNRRSAEADIVVGVDMSEARLAAVWPHARQHVSFSKAQFEDVVNDTYDLYYYDSEPRYPSWCTPEAFRTYLELIANGGLRSDSVVSALATIDVGDQSQGDKAQNLDHYGGSAEFRIAKFEARAHDAANESRSIRRVHRPPEKAAKKRVSLVGAGRWGLGMVARQITRDDRVVVRGVCDRRPEVLHLAQQALPFDFATTNYDDLLDDPYTDMVLVCPYHNSHGEFAARALEGGKHCYVEKPPVVDMEQLGRLCAAGSRSGQILYVGYNRRFAPATQLLMKHLSAVDGPVAFNATVRPMDIPDYKNWILWPSNGGSRVVSNLCHMMDLAMYVTGDSRPMTLSVVPSIHGRPEDNMSVTLQFENGSMATIAFTNRGFERKRGYNEKYHIMKGDIFAEIDNFESLVVEQSGRKVAHWNGVQDKGHRAQMATIANALVADGQAPFPVSTVRHSASMYLAVVRLLAQGGTAEPVEVPSDTAVKIAGLER